MRAGWIKLMIAAARLPLRSDPAKSQFLAQEPTAGSHGKAVSHNRPYRPASEGVFAAPLTTNIDKH